MRHTGFSESCFRVSRWALSMQDDEAVFIPGVGGKPSSTWLLTRGVSEVVLSCDPQHHHPAGEQPHTQSTARIQQHPCGKWWQRWGTALGHCWQTAWRHGFGNLEKNVGLKHRGGERALGSFGEDHVVMQGKQSRLVCMGLLPLLECNLCSGWGAGARCVTRWLRDAGGGKQKEAPL